MTILFTLPEILPDNRARFIQIVNTAHALAKCDNEVDLISGGKRRYKCRDILSYYSLPPLSGLKMTFLPIVRKNIPLLPVSWNAVFNYSLMSYLNKKRGVIFVRHPKLAGFLLERKERLKMPVIYEAHEIFSLSVGDNLKKRRYMWALENFIFGGSDGVITISRRLREDIDALFNTGNTPFITLPNAVRDDWLKERWEYELLSREYLFYAGSLYNWKGVDILIKAMKYLPDEKLVIAGGGSRLNQLRELSGSTGVSDRVVFLGHLRQRDIVDYLARAKICIIPNVAHAPSEYSSPLKLFEFMAAGVPIVASDLSGINEVLVDGIHGVLFEPGNVEALAGSITSILENPDMAKRIARNCYEKVKDFTYNKRAGKIMEFIDSQVTR
ncbi:glycogen synthase [bacterium BMS3Bbin06]|nr:glycogen synthase [bacterium BMS3Bbin06]